MRQKEELSKVPSLSDRVGEESPEMEHGIRDKLKKIGLGQAELETLARICRAIKPCRGHGT